MDKLAFSDEVLSQQSCSECLNYLSVGPVLVSSEGQICGRCSKNMPTFDNVLNHSMYNLVAEKLVFKCINHYSGCEELLFFNEATEHEKKCQKKRLVCPFCAFEGNGCQLVHHCKKEHPEEVVEGDTIKIIIADEFSRKLFFVKNSRIFCVAIFVNDTFIEIFNLLITPPHLDHEHFSLKFFKSGSNIQFVTTPIQFTQDRNNFPMSTLFMENVEWRENCFMLNQAEIVNSFPSGWCLCKVELTAGESDGVNLNCCNQIIRKIDTKLSASVSGAVDVGEEVYGEDFNLIDCILKMSIWNLRKFANSELYKWQKCGNCKRCLNGSSFYLCSKYHMACPECTNKKCPTCNVFCKWTKKSIVYNPSLECEWKSCHRHDNIFEYMVHKQHCEFRVYKCPDLECGFIERLDNLKNHWHLTPVESTIDLHVSPKNRDFYWLVSHNELFYVFTEFESRSGKFSVTVNEFDVVMHKRYEFDLLRMDKRSKGTVYRTESIKTRFDLPCGTESMRFVMYLKIEDLEKEFMLRWFY